MRMILRYILQNDLISALCGFLVVPSISTRSSPLISLRHLSKSFFRRLESNFEHTHIRLGHRSMTDSVKCQWSLAFYLNQKYLFVFFRDFLVEDFFRVFNQYYCRLQQSCNLCRDYSQSFSFIKEWNEKKIPARCVSTKFLVFHKVEMLNCTTSRYDGPTPTVGE